MFEANRERAEPSVNQLDGKLFLITKGGKLYFFLRLIDIPE